MNGRFDEAAYIRIAIVFTACCAIFLLLVFLPEYLMNGQRFIVFAPFVVFGVFMVVAVPLINRIAKKQEERTDVEYFRATNLLAVFAVVSFILIRMPEYLGRLQYAKAAIMLIASFGSIAIILLLMRFSKKKTTLAFFVPMVIFLLFVAATLVMKGSYYFFTVHLVLCGICTAYGDYRKLLGFVLLSNAVTLALVFLRQPLLGEGISFNDTLTGWIVAVYFCIFGLMLSRFVTEKSGRSTRAYDSFGTLMEATPNIKALVDDAGRVTDISRALAKLAGIEDPGMARGRPLIDLFREMDLKLMIRDILISDGFYETTKMLNINGNPRHFKIISADMKGAAMGKFIEIVDITPIVLAKFEAERSAEAKSLFLANTSHEIRTPMNAILGMTELILRDELPPGIRENALTIRRSASNLLSIINDILDFSKIESGKMEIVPAVYEPASLLHDVINIIRMRITEDGVLFTVNIDSKLPRALIGDEARLRQIFINLLSNAVKYTEKGHIYLEVGIGKRVSDEEVQLSFTVVDTGVGIREEDMDKLFDDFIRLDARKNSGVVGTGLGLAISRNLCRMMDGDISVFSQYGKGSVFTATVLQKVKDESPLAVVDAPETKTVLLYEPNILCARSIARSLRNLGVRRRIVSNREEFAAALQRERYSFIFMSAGLYDSALDLLTAFAPQSVPVLLSEFDEAIIRSNVRLIMMPAHIMSIANVLNDTDDADIDARNAGEETIVRFVAPKARMLIVDDNITNLKVAEGLLTPYRLQTDTCTSGAAALRLAQTHKYDLIFMDHMMPEMDGVEAVALIRAMDGEYFRSLPIIALTANAISGMREMLLQNGFSDYLAKPIEIKRLNEVMDKWVPAEKREKQEAPAAHAGVPVFGFEIEGLDVAAGLALTGGAREQYREVLLLCCEDAGERMEALRETPNEAGLARFVIDVHALKGALASIGAKSLSKEAAKLEVAGKEGDLPYISEYLAGFRERLTQLMARIRRAFPEADDPAGAGASEPLDEETLSRLKDALSSENVHSADYCLDALMKTTRDAGTRKLLTEISNMILTASFSEAIQSTESLRERIATPGAAVRNDASRGAT